MDIEDIKDIIEGDETRTLELKKTTGELKDGMHAACAFLNTDGGWLIFGIAPASLKILGQEVTDNTRREIALALSGIEPSVDVRVEYVDVLDRPGCQVIAMHLDEWIRGMAPYTFHGKPYMKVESTTKPMPRDMFEEKLRMSRPRFFAWESQIAEEIGIEDLDEEKIRNAVRYGIQMGRINNSAGGAPIESLLSKFKLLKDGKPTNAALMLFGKDTSDYPQLMVRMARFRGLNKNEFIDNQRTSGNFFEMLDACMAFFFKHLNLNGKIVGFRREEYLEIPQVALREATINALCHRSMDNPGASMSIGVYDDRIEIFNPGGLPKELSLETIKQPHESFPRNLRIAQVLYLTGYLESWGSGIKRIMDACKEANVPEPEYSADDYSVKVTFRLPHEAQNIQAGTKQALSKHQVGTKLGLSWDQADMLFDKLSEQVSASELRAALGYSDATKFKKRYLDILMSEGIIAQTDPDHPRNPNQKYSLTDKGKYIE